MSAPVAYALVFTMAAVGCVAGAVRARRVEDAATRRGLVALLVTTSGWAASHAVLLLLSGRSAKTAVYLLGLVLGFSTVFAWLYFCSAYTGRSYHRRSTYRRAAVALYLVVVAVKLTNPLHHLYFTTGFVASPFPHLAIRQGLFHWIVTGLSYTLATVGMFALFETFREADYDARPLAVLVGLSGAPVVLDIVGYASPLLIDVIHAPLGVAAFAVGTLFVFEDRFFAVQLTDGVEGATIFLDDDRRIREFNDAARRLFPALDGAVGDPLDALPAVAAALDDDDGVVDVEVEGEPRHYVVTENAFDVGQGSLSRVVVFSDVTRIERHRRELERHDRQLEDLARGMRHELRNAVTVIRGNVRSAAARLDAGEVAAAREALRTATDTTDRTTRLMNDFATLAQYGQTVTDPEPVDVPRVARAAWAGTDHGDAALAVECEGSVPADPARFEVLLERAFEFFLDSGATSVVVDRRDGDLTITGDGDPPTGDPEQYFEYGDAAGHGAVGTALPMVRTLAQVHGWGATVDPDYRDGVRIVLTLSEATGF
ncbi:histidine kinase N-terminal 7TM domain-containing protein [Haloplanus halophilus]|uniref:histidine kinase N-terminal 7TM domain-containing protein n=1 Tax=Haloplanus halophilus TaxID=2949993 RepID=UPI0020402C08|nr:histidine kinase N-terminal 7TM domain-containing protein [Haloplanus sp. GDY1]